VELADHAKPPFPYALGLGLITLARGVQRDLRSAAKPVLEALSRDVGATAIMSLVEGDDIVCIASVEPSDGMLRVRYREGYRHPVDRGAGGLAVLSARPPAGREREEIVRARELGFAATSGELEPGATAISAPVRVPHGNTRLSITVLLPENKDVVVDIVGARVIAAAADVAALF